MRETVGEQLGLLLTVGRELRVAVPVHPWCRPVQQRGRAFPVPDQEEVGGAFGKAEAVLRI